MSQFLDELKRRNVFRVAVAYIVTTWLILQVADVVLNNIEAPGWVFSVFLLALALGFLPVLFFSWAYEITPEGIRKESEVDRSRSITPETGRKLNAITIIMLVAVVGFVVVERTMFRETAEPAATAATAGDASPPEVTTTAVDERSIAVLAFDDLSQTGDQAFFAEGLSEELLNVLAQVPGLKVAGRTSSFAFKGKDTDLREIGEILNVAHILEGSVRKAGDRIRVTAQLIKASDGFHLFSETYDRDLDDVFAVQDELAALISESLKAELKGDDELPQVTPTDLASYDLYLSARQRLRTRIPELMYEARDMLDEALKIDPDYPPALAQRALAVYLLSDVPGAYGDIPETEARAEALALLDRALGIDRENADALAVLGLVQTDYVGNDEDAIVSLRKALEINPNHESAKLWLANVLTDETETRALYEEVILRDPLYSPAFNNLIQQYVGTSEFDQADALIARVERVSGPDDAVNQARGTVAFLKGDLAEAARTFRVAYNVNPNARVVQMWYGYSMIQIGEMEAAADGGRKELQMIALRELGDFDAADRILDEMDFTVGDRQRQIRHGADYLASRGRPREMAEIVERVYGGPEKIIRDLDMRGGWGAEYLGPLAYVYLQTGDEEAFRVIMDELKFVLDRANQNGYDNWYRWYSEAQFAALDGNADAAVGFFEKAVDGGFVSVVIIEPLFDLLREDQRFLDLEARARARADEERAKLGLDPYRPIAPTD